MLALKIFSLIFYVNHYDANADSQSIETQGQFAARTIATSAAN
jgi:hypothetical protein